MSDIALTGREPYLDVLARAVGYTGRKFCLSIAETVDVTDHGWQDGSREKFTIVNLATGAIMSVPEQTAFTARIAGSAAVTLPPGFVAVEHRWFCGKDMGLRIHVGPDTIRPGMLPAPASLTDDERAVLVSTRSHKSSYGGDRNYRRTESGLTVARWDAAVATLKERGLLNKAGAITVDGRNAVGSAL